MWTARKLVRSFLRGVGGARLEEELPQITRIVYNTPLFIDAEVFDVAGLAADQTGESDLVQVGHF